MGLPVKNQCSQIEKELKSYFSCFVCTAEKKIPLRFIEMMPVGYGKNSM